MRISLVWRVSARQNHYDYSGFGFAMCVFHWFGGYRLARTTMIIVVWDLRSAYFLCLEDLDSLWDLRCAYLLGFEGIESPEPL